MPVAGSGDAGLLAEHARIGTSGARDRDNRGRLCGPALYEAASAPRQSAALHRRIAGCNAGRALTLLYPPAC